jgi:hypothetical protein
MPRRLRCLLPALLDHRAALSSGADRHSCSYSCCYIFVVVLYI